MTYQQISDNDVLLFVKEMLPYVVVPRNFNDVRNPLETDEGRWCYEQFGQQLMEECENWSDAGFMWDVVNPHARWDCWERLGYGFTYYFRTVADAALFKLTWG